MIALDVRVVCEESIVFRVCLANPEAIVLGKLLQKSGQPHTNSPSRHACRQIWTAVSVFGLKCLFRASSSRERIHLWPSDRPPAVLEEISDDYEVHEDLVKIFASIDARVLAFCSDPLKVRRGFPKDTRYALLPVNAVDSESGILYVDC